MQRGSIRILLVGVLIVVALSVVLLRGDQLRELITTMEGGDLIPLVLAVAAQFGKYISQSYAYANAFRVVGEPGTQPREMLPLVFGSYFMNVIAPSFNTAGVMLVIDSARRRGIPTGRATSAALLMQISVITGFLVIMIVGFSVLQVAGHLSPVWFLLGMVMVFLTGVMVAVMYIGHKDPETLVNLLTPIERFVNRLSQRFRAGRELDPWANRVVDSFSEAGGKIRESPRQALKVFGFSVLASSFELCCFCLVGIAFGLRSAPVLVGGYVVATLFSWVAITPQGVGVVEAMLVVALAASRVNAATATALALVYRGIVFWMPFAIGAVLIHRTNSFKRRLPRSSRRLLKGRRESADGDGDEGEDEGSAEVGAGTGAEAGGRRGGARIDAEVGARGDTGRRGGASPGGGARTAPDDTPPRGQGPS